MSVFQKNFMQRLSSDPCKRCELFTRNINYRICIPPPAGKIRGCLISRDPTSAFIEPLKEYRQHPHERKGLLWFDAPPKWLYQKIKMHMGYDEKSTELANLQDFLNCKCYWTHLHKCPTCKKGKADCGKHANNTSERYPHFHYSTAKGCADLWFESEFEKNELKDKIVIALGRDVEKYFREWSLKHPKITSNHIIALPHPSRVNCGNGWSWNKNSLQKKEIINQIEKFIELL